MLIKESEKYQTAYHEGGHALVALLSEGAPALHKLTILPRGPALGFVIRRINIHELISFLLDVSQG